MDISKNKLDALSQTLLDFSKILLAALVAADFIKFEAIVRILIVVCLLASLLAGLLLKPDERGG